jgi:menaquinone-dependent protoporphyrinogen IX oxidase
MSKILVAYTTNSGSTAEVATEIGKELAINGRQVDVRRLEEVTGLDDYDAVVVGAPMILGWHSAALKFIKQNQTALTHKKVAYFCTALSLTRTDDSIIHSIPLQMDPDLAIPPVHAGRLSFKERYSTPTNYLNPILKAAPAVKPLRIGFFGGKLEMFRLKFWQAAFVMIIIRAQPGDVRNWPFIQTWARELNTEFSS